MLLNRNFPENISERIEDTNNFVKRNRFLKKIKKKNVLDSNRFKMLKENAENSKLIRNIIIIFR
jgi:hypothetical protein